VIETPLYTTSWPKKSRQTWTYVSDRAAVIAVSNLPLLFVFASRNDVFLWLTGWSFATFNMFHRWIARVVTVEALLHGVGYTVQARLGASKHSPETPSYDFAHFIVHNPFAGTDRGRNPPASSSPLFSPTQTLLITGGVHYVLTGGGLCGRRSRSL
jgi:hypothetical protein